MRSILGHACSFKRGISKMHNIVTYRRMFCLTFIRGQDSTVGSNIRMQLKRR